MEDGVVAYTYMKKTVCLNCFACMRLSETLGGDNSFFVATMGLPIHGIKICKDGLLSALAKWWKRSSERSLIDTIAGDARFWDAMRRRMVKVAARRIRI